MPELPEVETIVRGLRERIKGKIVARVSMISPLIMESPPQAFNESITGARILSISRRGKFILIGLSTGYTLLVHLGMTGRLTCTASSIPVEKHTHLIVRLGPENELELRYADIRRFGRLLVLENGEVNRYLEEKKLGPEPLSISGHDFCRRLSSRRGRIKALLLNQSFVSGLGNIYADEILHRALIHPLRESCSLSPEERERLHRAMVEVLKQAIEKKGSSINDYKDVEGRKGGFQNHHCVYRRTGRPCFTCGSEIVRGIVAGRGTHYCPVCQPLSTEKRK